MVPTTRARPYTELGLCRRLAAFVTSPTSYGRRRRFAMWARAAAGAVRRGWSDRLVARGHRAPLATVSVVDECLRQRIERHVLRFVATPSRHFPALRASGQVDLPLVRLGAQSHPNPRIRWQCLTVLDHLDG